MISVYPQGNTITSAQIINKNVIHAIV
jgi:hypothetical protein